MVLTDEHYTGLLAVRSSLSHFHQLGEREARLVGLTHVQHHALLAIRAHPQAGGPMIADIARALAVRSHSAVEVVSRLVAAELLERHRDSDDGRIVRLRLIGDAPERLSRLSEPHLERLRQLTTRGAGLLQA